MQTCVDLVGVAEDLILCRALGNRFNHLTSCNRGATRHDDFRAVLANEEEAFLVAEVELHDLYGFREWEAVNVVWSLARQRVQHVTRRHIADLFARADIHADFRATAAASA